MFYISAILILRSSGCIDMNVDVINSEDLVTQYSDKYRGHYWLV